MAYPNQHLPVCGTCLYGLQNMQRSVLPANPGPVLVTVVSHLMSVL